MNVGHSLRLAVAALVLASVAFTFPPASASVTAQPSGTITFAETPGANPNFIFPFMGCAYASLNNINQFQMLMFRPLFWFGLAGSSEFEPSISLADRPTFSHGDRTVTITMKGWRFADGQMVNARSVMFFLNMYKADPTAYCGYNAGYGIPDQVKSAAGHGNTVRINFTTSVNPNWILDNYLSQITPMPDRWDRTSSSQTSTCADGTYGAASTNAACNAVVAYLTKQGSTTSTFASDLWQGGDDGPWRLSAFSANGNATFQPNYKYRGPQRAQVRFVKEIAYTTIQGEESDLLNHNLSLGYIDPSVLANAAPAPGHVGPNWIALASRYSIVTGSTWGFNYAAFNFTSSDPNAAAVDQLYIRQALQYAVDQRSIIEIADKGYGSAIDSPLPPSTPRTLSKRIVNPYPFNLAAARTLLSSHGWTLVNDVQTCTSPGTGTGQCGASIAQGYQLTFNVVWPAGSASLDQTLTSEIVNWQSLGIQITHSTDTFNNVISDCTGSKPFEICAWGYGWSYVPSDYPSGESLFLPGGDFNVGTYVNAKMTSLIKGSIYGTSNLSAYATFAALQLPVLYQPQANSIGEVARVLKSSVGFAPNPLGDFMPEYFHF
ncbi:MAG TPA: ABC transporter substrate-binding protein [Acidimicrobiales bacterium]|nr:ABC transporter substrate-binding protein [Acidimicrobiales bacterium]